LNSASAGEENSVGNDSGDAVSSQHTTPGTFKGGEISLVGVTVEKTQYLDLEKDYVTAHDDPAARRRASQEGLPAS